MDNVLFVPTVLDTEWMLELSEGDSLAATPVVGRRYIDYAFECAQRFGILFTEILDWNFSKDLAVEFSDLTRTGFPVFYQKGEGEIPQGLDDLGRFKASPLTQDLSDGLVVVWGLCLSAHKADEITMEPLTPEECANTPAGIYRRQEGKWMRILPRGLIIRNLEGWHRMNMAVLRGGGGFTLPGYSAEQGVHMGRNVVMEHGTEAKPPVLLSDNSWCARNVRLDGEVIIGNGSFVSEGARLKRTVVCNNTFIGEGLDLEDKIVIGHRIIDVASGVWTDIEEPEVARRIGGERNWISKLWNFLQGASRGRRF